MARSEARFQELAAHLPDYVAIVDRDRRFRWVNRVAPGVTLERILASRVDDFIDCPYTDRMRAAIEHVLATGEPTEFEVTAYGDGVALHRYLTRAMPAAPMGGEPRVLLITQDVTRVKRAEDALRASERHLHELLARLPDYVIELDGDRRIRYVNRTHPATSEGEVLGRRIDELAIPAIRDEVAEKLERLFATGEDVSWTAESTSDPGAYLVHALRIPGERPRALVIAKDISGERDARRRLTATEERLERALRASNLVLWERDLDTDVAWVYGATARVLGVHASSMDRSEWLELVHPDDRDHALAAQEAHVAGRTPSMECEYRIRHRDTGQWHHVFDRARLLERPGGARVLAGSALDMTAIRAEEQARRELEQRLEHAQRLDSIGLLAGGIAHDFNNLLTVVLAGAEHARTRLARGDDARDVLSEVVEAARRASGLTQQLLAFSRRNTLDVEDVEIVPLVRAVVGMAARTFPRTIAIEIVDEDVRATVRGDRQRLEQVMLNLCLNARDAMPGGGRLTIRIALDGDDGVVLEVEDTGVGIREADLARIFDPFFTTKPVGSGTGLGLSVAHGIVEQHGGSIRVESAPGRGTTMRVRLPRASEPVALASASFVAPRAGSETVLVVEDEPLVLRTASRILSEAGYRVLEACDGTEAVETYRAHAREIDLVFLDVVMPSLDGWRARREIRAIDPAACVLLTSGYAAAAIPHGAADGLPVLLKPYHPEALLTAVRDALDRRSDAALDVTSG